MKKVFVKCIYTDGNGKPFVGNWEALRYQKEFFGKWYVRRMIKKGEIVEFLGFGYYGVWSVEGWLWFDEERVCVEKLGLL